MRSPELQPNEEEKPKYEKVSELSAQYQSDRLGGRAASDMIEPSFFGSAYLSKIRELENRAKPIDEQLSIYPGPLRDKMLERVTHRVLSREQVDAEIKAGTKRSVAVFKEALSDRNLGPTAETILKESVNEPSIREMVEREGKQFSKKTLARYSASQRQKLPEERYLEAIFGTIKYYDTALISLNALVGSKKISPELWQRVLANNGKEFRAKAKNFKELLLPALEEKFRIQIKGAIERGELSSLTVETLDRRVKETSVVLQDAIEAQLDGLAGTYSVDTGDVKIAAYLVYPAREKMLERAYFHEMLHALSGRTILKQNRNAGEMEYDEPHLHQRTGLRFNIFQTGMNRFRWLNEAVTKILENKYAEPLHGGRSDYSYHNEANLFQVISQKGVVPVKEKLFFDAYFENLDPDLPPEKRLPAWKALSEKMEEAWGAGFLNRLDAKTKQIGVKKAMDLLESGGGV